MAQAISKMETTQTAVDWLLKYIERENWSLPQDIEEQAKEMEKKQIVDAFYEGMQSSMFDPNKGRALIYYNETYNQ